MTQTNNVRTKTYKKLQLSKMYLFVIGKQSMLIVSPKMDAFWLAMKLRIKELLLLLEDKSEMVLHKMRTDQYYTFRHDQSRIQTRPATFSINGTIVEAKRDVEETNKLIDDNINILSEFR